MLIWLPSVYGFIFSGNRITTSDEENTLCLYRWWVKHGEFIPINWCRISMDFFHQCQFRLMPVVKRLPCMQKRKDPRNFKLRWLDYYWLKLSRACLSLVPLSGSITPHLPSHTTLIAATPAQPSATLRTNAKPWPNNFLSWHHLQGHTGLHHHSGTWGERTI